MKDMDQGRSLTFAMCCQRTDCRELLVPEANKRMTLQQIPVWLITTLRLYRPTKLGLTILVLASLPRPGPIFRSVTGLRARLITDDSATSSAFNISPSTVRIVCGVISEYFCCLTKINQVLNRTPDWEPFGLHVNPESEIHF